VADIFTPKIIRSNRRTLTLSVASDATLVVKAPLFVSMGDIQSFINKHKDWIDKRTKKVEAVAQKQFSSGETYLYLGTHHILQFGEYKNIQAKGGKILFPKFLQFRAKKELTNWYIQKAKDLITAQVKYYAPQMKAKYKTVSFADTKSRWGVCTHDNHLQFNWRLVMAPLLVINYVVVHELTHTIEKNHSFLFWNKVRYFNPTFKHQRNWLKTHGDILTIG